MKTLTIVSAVCAVLVSTQAFAATIIVDENGHGSVGSTALPSSVRADPGPSGLGSALTYTLPFDGVPGDVALFDPNLGFPGDLIRFNGNSTLVFYSDNVSGIDSLADTPAPPATMYANSVVVNEVGPANNNSAAYTPGPNDPGFDASHPSYVFVSDQVPEPNSLLMFSAGFLVLGAALIGRQSLRRRRSLGGGR